MFLSAKRVVWTFGGLFIVLAALLWAAFFVVSSLTEVATELVQKALLRYNNFTGKLALQNFPEDKVLYNQVQNLQETVLPFLEILSPVLIVFGVLFSVIALVCFLFPKRCASFLVRIKLWKFSESENLDSFGVKAIHLPWKRILPVVLVIVLIVILIVAIRSCIGISSQKVSQELKETSLYYVQTIKANFGKTQKIVSPDSLPESEVFDYSIQKGRFVAKLKEDVDKCNKGNVWSISPSVKGLFKKTLSIYRKPPQDSACQQILPDFKSIGK